MVLSLSASRKTSQSKNHHSTTATKTNADVFTVRLRRPFNRLVSKKNAAVSDISSIAKQLRERLSKAAKSITAVDAPNMHSMSTIDAEEAMDYCSTPLLPSPSFDNEAENEADDDVTMETASAESTTPVTPMDAPAALPAPKTPANHATSNENNENNKKKATTTTTTTLRNLQLLKQYFLFISRETTDIQLAVSNDQLTFQYTPADEDQTARLGASLIESLVHESPMMMEKRLKLLQVGSKSVQNRRGPGRPPKGANTNDETTTQKRRKSSFLQQQNHLEKQKKKKENCNTIRCICDTPHDEFGSMVQCDDCYHWLHVECLELSDDALEEDEPFRCPLCFLNMGSIYEDSSKNAQTAKMLSSISWRYAAQWKSRRLADSARYDNHGSDDEDEDDYDMMVDDLSTHPLEIDEKVSVSSHPTLKPINTVLNEVSPVTLSPSPLTPVNYIPLQALRSEDDDGYSTNEDVTTAPLTPTSTDWPDISSESRYSISSQDSLSTVSSVCSSEVTTPMTELSSPPSSSLAAAAAMAAVAASTGVYASDSFELKEMNQLLINQTVESLEILHQLFYLESSLQHNRTPKLFSPNASDVFLCGEDLAKDNSSCSSSSSSTPVPLLTSQTSYFNTVAGSEEATSSHLSTTHSTNLSATATTNKATASNKSLAAPPSDVCSQELTEYSFDSGPFWNPLY